MKIIKNEEEIKNGDGENDVMDENKFRKFVKEHWEGAVHNFLAEAYAHLKKAPPKPTIVSEDDDSKKQPFASVQLKKAEPATAQQNDGEDVQPFASVQLKKSAPEASSSEAEAGESQPLPSDNIMESDPDPSSEPEPENVNGEQQ